MEGKSYSRKNDKNQISAFDYKKILTGNIKYSKDANSITGYIRLKKDPKGESFGSRNIILREEQLKNASFIYGLVLFSGVQCLCFQTKHKSKNSFFDSKSRMFFGLSFINCFSLALVIYLS
jgi:hypothetical protein